MQRIIQKVICAGLLITAYALPTYIHLNQARANNQSNNLSRVTRPPFRH